MCPLIIPVPSSLLLNVIYCLDYPETLLCNERLYSKPFNPCFCNNLNVFFLCVILKPFCAVWITQDVLFVVNSFKPLFMLICMSLMPCDNLNPPERLWAAWFLCTVCCPQSDIHTFLSCNNVFTRTRNETCVVLITVSCIYTTEASSEYPPGL